MQEFVSIVSHDFRAPIRHLRQFSNILANSLTAPTAEQQECAAFIKSSTELCDGMMEALSQLSQIYTRRIEAEAIDFAALFARACSVFAAQYDCQPRLSSDCVTRKPYMDAWHAQILVDELVSNAFKFRHRDAELAIHLKVANLNDQLLVELSDNGIGMPARFLGHCTTIYRQLDNAVDGVGKGLTLVEHIGRRYRGSVRIDSSQTTGESGTIVGVALSLAPH